MIKDDIQAYWTLRAPTYSQANLEELKTQKQSIWRDLILSNAPQKEDLRVLDVGTGPGFFAITLALAGHQVSAVDVTQAMLDQAQSNAQAYGVTLDCVHADVHCLPFESNTFDLIVMRNLTWDLDQPKQAYQEWYRLLKKGGRLLNFDANWYLYLYDQEHYVSYQQDRNNIEQHGLEDYCVMTDIDTSQMERIAAKLPLSKVVRPAWDQQVLDEIGFTRIHIQDDISNQVWDECEMVNFASTPMFMIVAEK